MTDRTPQCSVQGCGEAGPVKQRATGKFFCINHAYAADRIDEAVDEYGLSHPENPTEDSTPKKIVLVERPPVKKSLEDIGTRWQFLADFQDHIADGIHAVNLSLQRYDNPNDVLRKRNLEMSLRLVEVYQMQMAGYEQKKWDLNSMLDKCAPSREVLAQIRAEKEHEVARRQVEHERKRKTDGDKS